jgi:hypothetical protein
MVCGHSYICYYRLRLCSIINNSNRTNEALERWNTGKMEYWKDGILEGWNIGIMAVSNFTFPLLHYSNLPEVPELKKQLLYHTFFRI